MNDNIRHYRVCEHCGDAYDDCGNVRYIKLSRKQKVVMTAICRSCIEFFNVNMMQSIK